MVIENRGPVGEVRETKTADPSLTAYKFFLKANEDFSVSHIAQASSIAMQCQETKSNPAVLRNALLGSNELLDRIAKVGNDVHKYKKAEKAPYIDRNWVEYIINEDFGYAERMMPLSQSELLSIQKKYHEVERTKKGDVRMMVFAERVIRNNRIKSKLGQLGRSFISFFKK